MPLISEVIKQLEYFSSDADVSAIINRLLALELSGERDEIIESLRQDLQRIVSDAKSPEIKSDDLSLKDTAYHALLALAETDPINDVDPITMESISPDNRVIISTGHQFEVHTLIAWFRELAREKRLKNLEEFFNGNNCSNPLTRQPFSPEDAAHVWEVAKRKIPDLEEAFPQRFRQEFFQNRHGVNTINELAALVRASPERREDFYNQINTDDGFNRLILNNSFTQLAELIPIFPEHREDFYNRINATADNFNRFTYNSLSQVVGLVQIFPEHREDFYNRINNDEAFRRMTFDSANQLAILVQAFPEHARELNDRFNQRAPVRGAR